MSTKQNNKIKKTAEQHEKKEDSSKAIVNNDCDIVERENISAENADLKQENVALQKPEADQCSSDVKQEENSLLPEEEITENDDEIVIIEGGGSEYVIESDPEEKPSEIITETTPECTRNKLIDKKIADYGTYISAAIFLAAILLSIFNMKGFKYPLSFLLMGFGGLSMGITAVLRYFNNKKCGCKVCATQAKTFIWSSILWSVVFIAGLVTFIILTIAV